MKKVIFLVFTAFFLFFAETAFSQEDDDYDNTYGNNNADGKNNSDVSNDNYSEKDSYSEYDGYEEAEGKVQLSLKTFIGVSYFDYSTLRFENSQYDAESGSNGGMNIQLGMSLFNDFYVNVNADFLMDNPDGLSKITGAVGWKRINAMVRYQDIKDKYKKPNQTETNSSGNSNEAFSPEDFSVKILTADLQYDIFGLPFSNFEGKNWSGIFLGLTYCRYTLPAKLKLGSYAEELDSELHMESGGLSLYFDSMVSTLVYGSDLLTFEADDFSILPWFNLYGNFHIGCSKISDEAAGKLNSKIIARGDTESVEEQIWLGGVVVDAIIGLGVIYRAENFTANLAVGFAINLVSGFMLSPSGGEYSPSLTPSFQREGWTVKAGVSF